MKKDENKNEKSGSNKKIAIGAAIASVAAAIGIGAILKARKSKKEKQAK